LSRFDASGTVTRVNTRTGQSLAIPKQQGRSGTRRAADDPAAVAAQELFARCERRVGSFLVQMVRDRGLAEDLLQDTFHDAFRARSELVLASNREAWLFAIARNRALSALRRRRRYATVVARLSLPRTTDQDSQEVLALRDLLERHLDPDERGLLLLRYLHGFDAAELALIVGISPEAIRQRLSRSRRKLIAASDAQAGTDSEEK
jgi:RNA polymerase sigma-70 factor (ECF subfamily)